MSKKLDVLSLLTALLLGTALAGTAHAAGKFEECKEGANGAAPKMPCAIPSAEKTDVLIDMLLANGNGYKVSPRFKLVRNGLMQSPFRDSNADSVRILMLSEGQLGREYITKVRYDLVLLDCRGTDACDKSFVWTVIQTTRGDGYTSTTKYENFLARGDKLP